LVVSRVTASPGRKSAYLLIVLALACAAVAALSAPSTAEAAQAKPCWKRLIDDWVDNGRFDHFYSANCIAEARQHLPEDIRAYSDIEEKMDAMRQEAVRRVQSVSPPTSGQSDPPSQPPVRSQTGEPVPQATPGHDPRDPGPIVQALNKDTTNADSIPLPLILLAGLALLLMAAGASGIIHRKLQARRASVRRPS
jgi:hypothetical protein